MIFDAFIDRDWKVASCLASWVVALSLLAAWGVGSANANMIVMVESESAEKADLSYNGLMMPADWLTSANCLSGGFSSDSIGCSDPTTWYETPSCQASPEMPIEVLTLEPPLVGVGIPAPSCGTTADPGSIEGGTGSSLTGCQNCWASQVWQPTIVDRIYAATEFDISSGRPFELLRPPQAPTIPCV